MNTNNKKLEQFTSGNLSELEEDHFLSQLLKMKFDKEQKDAWQKKLEEKYQVLPPQKKRNNVFSIRRILSIAASVAIIVACIFVIRTMQTPDYNALASQYIETGFPSNPEYSRKGVQDIDELRSTANLAYVEKDYQKSASILEKIVANGSNIQASDWFYLGLSYLFNNQIKESVAAFQFVQQQNIKYQAESKWFLSLAFIKNKQAAEAKKLLTEIVNNSTISYKKNEAMKLLEAMK